jgi:CheY-like chemotaxis protein
MITFSPRELQTRILVVENVGHMAKILLEMIRAMGFRDVHRASNIVHAFQFVAAGSPNLIIGEAVIQPFGVTRLCRTLRVGSDSQNREIPVIITVAEPTATVVAAARDAGCHGIVAKPVSAANLATRIAAILRNPPSFVATRAYTGPERRRTAMPLKGAERRISRILPPADHTLPMHQLLGIDPEVLAGSKPPPAHLVAEDNGRALTNSVPAPVLRKVLVSQAEAGMELAEPIKAGESLVVVPRGVVLTRDLVPRLVDLAHKEKIPSTLTIRA